ARSVLKGDIFDNTYGADHYYAAYVDPSWRNDKHVVAIVNTHIFQQETSAAPRKTGGYMADEIGDKATVGGFFKGLWRKNHPPPPPINLAALAAEARGHYKKTELTVLLPKDNI